MTRTTASLQAPASSPPSSATSTHRLLLAAGLASALTAVVATLWLSQPAWNGFETESSGLLRTWLSAGAVAMSQLIIGLLGMVSASLALRAAHRAANWPRWLAPLGIAQTLFIGLGLIGMGVIAALGYLLALVMPLALAFVVLQLVRRGERVRWIAVAITAVVLVAALATGILTGPAAEALRDVLVQLPSALAQVSPFMLLLCTALAWAAVSVQAARRGGGTGLAPGIVLRHRRLITVLAAVGPLPYALVRLTWLTPWPLQAPADADPDILFWGFALSLGAWAGSVLTLGLIRPWGETFPRWLPVIAGRPVPVALAAVPGGIVAGAVCAAAVPLLRSFAQHAFTDTLASALIMPFWFWGPMLALAVWGYVLHRQQQSELRAVT
ncbi:MAG TPA: hypothetical protein VK095_08265 [Beutenbergiaceae bacterium]|nr:hypothetical protein [Beutenbergiaceae bacterium]